MEIKQNAQRGTKEEVAIIMSDAQLGLLKAIFENQIGRIEEDMENPEFLKAYNDPSDTLWKRGIDNVLQMSKQMSEMIKEYCRAKQMSDMRRY